MPNALGAILGGVMTGAVAAPPYGPLPVRALEQPSVINGGPFLHAVPEPMTGCSEYTVSVHDTNYGQVRRKPSLSGRPLWRLIVGSNVTICSKNITTDERNIAWIWVRFKSQEELWTHEGYMSFRILQPFVHPMAPTLPSKPPSEANRANPLAPKEKPAAAAQLLWCRPYFDQPVDQATCQDAANNTNRAQDQSCALGPEAMGIDKFKLCCMSWR